MPIFRDIDYDTRINGELEVRDTSEFKSNLVVVGTLKVGEMADLVSAINSKLNHTANSQTLTGDLAITGELVIGAVDFSTFKSAYDSHSSDSNIHVTINERTAWNAKWDYDESTIKSVKVDSSINADTVNNLTVLTAVPANAKFTDTVYSHPSTHSLSMITETTDLKIMTSEERSKLSGIEDSANNYSHPNSHEPSIITQDASNRFVTDAQIENWNAAKSHADSIHAPSDAPSGTAFSNHTSDSVSHITSSERSNWNAAKTHADQDHAPADAPSNESFTGHTGDSTIHITSTERTSWNSAKTHADSDHAPADAPDGESFDAHTGNSTIHITSSERTNWDLAKSHADTANIHLTENQLTGLTSGNNTSLHKHDIYELATNLYTKNNLQTNGEAMVHWGNITDVPNELGYWKYKIGSEETTVSGGNTVEFIAGDNITISKDSGIKIDAQVYTAGTGLSLSNGQFINTDLGSAQNIFKNFKHGSTTISAGSNNDTLNFSASGAASISFNTSTKTITFSATDTNTTYSAGTGLQLSGTVFSNSDRGSSQNIFKNITDGTSTITAGQNNDSLTIVGSGATSIAYDTANKKITISSIDTDTTYSAGTNIGIDASNKISVSASPTFTGLTVSGNIAVTGTVDGVSISTFKTAYDTHSADTTVHILATERTAWNAKSELALGETSTTAYRGDKGKTAYDHSQLTSNVNPHGTRHQDLASIGANDHHNQVHSLVGTDHTASGLTVGHVVRASGTSSFAWAQLKHSDLGGITATDHHSNANDPTSGEKAALAGTNGTPSSSNKYVTNSDSRLTNSRTPVSHGNSLHSDIDQSLLKADEVEFSAINLTKKTGPAVNINLSDSPEGTELVRVRVGNQDMFYVTSEGNMYVAGNLEVVGDVTYSDEEIVDGDFEIKNDLYVGGSIRPNEEAGELLLVGNIILETGKTIDGIDLSEHIHDGTAGNGKKISYANLTNTPTSASWTHNSLAGVNNWTTGTNTTTPYHITQAMGKKWEDHADSLHAPSNAWVYNEATIKAVKVDNATNADNANTVNNLTVLTAVPANAVFTDTQRPIHTTPNSSATTTSISSSWAHAHNAGTGNEKHVPSAGTTGQFLAHNGAWATPPDTKYTAGTNLSLSAQNQFSVVASPSFTNITVSGTVDGVDISAFKSDYDDFKSDYENHDHKDDHYTKDEIDTMVAGKALGGTITIEAGETEGKWEHDFGTSNYAISCIADTPARHLYIISKDADECTVGTDYPHTEDIKIDIVLVSY